VAAARAQLGEEAFAAAWEAGQSISISELLRISHQEVWGELA
jgi:hypothetical protein